MERNLSSAEQERLKELRRTLKENKEGIAISSVGRRKNYNPGSKDTEEQTGRITNQQKKQEESESYMNRQEILQAMNPNSDKHRNTTKKQKLLQENMVRLIEQTII